MQRMSKTMWLFRMIAAAVGATLLFGAGFSADPGIALSASAANDSKPGSVLIYNLFTSDPKTQTETEITLTNISETAGTTVHLFFINGATGKSTEVFSTLRPAQTTSVLASNVAPGVTGYVIAVAVSDTTGCPVSFNFLRGSAFVKLNSGHSAKLGAVAISGLFDGVLSGCTALSVSAQLPFDGASYDRLPRTIAISNVASPLDGNSTYVAINRIGGSLRTGLQPIGKIAGIVHDDIENSFSFLDAAPNPQLAGVLASGFPNTSLPFEGIVPFGRSGWLEYFASDNIGLMGASINLNIEVDRLKNGASSPSQISGFNGGSNLHYLTLNASETLEMPVSLPESQLSADLVLTQTASAAATSPSSLLNYTITVTNRGPGIARSVVVTDVLPDSVTFISCSATAAGVCGGAGNNRTINFATLKSGDSAVIILTVKIAATAGNNQMISNAASVIAATRDPDQTNNAASFAVTIQLPVARIIPGTTFEFPAVAAEQAPNPNPVSVNFTVQNIGSVPLIITPSELRRIGEEANRVIEVDDRSLFDFRRIEAGGSAVPVQFGSEIIIAGGAQQNFRIFFNPLLPPVANNNQSLTASQIISPQINSRLRLGQNGGAPLDLTLIGRVLTKVRLIHPDDPRRAPLVTVTRTGNELEVTSAVWDPNLDLYDITYQFLDAAGRSIATPVTVNVASAIQQGNYVKGQSLLIIQKFTGVDRFANLSRVQVTVFDREGTDTAPSLALGEVAVKVAGVNAASFAGPRLAGEMIAAAFGSNLAASTQIAASTPLPTSLGGARLLVRDAAGVERAAPLFFVSPTQINFQMPPGTANGAATLSVIRDDGKFATGIAVISTVAPGLFTADATGQGVATGSVLRVRADGSQVFEPLSRFDPARNQIVAVPIDVSAPNEQVFLVMFGTGIRNRSSQSAVTVKVGGRDAEVLYAGAQGDFVGLDQLNLRLPSGLNGRGDVNIEIVVDGLTANMVKCNIK